MKKLVGLFTMIFLMSLGFPALGARDNLKHNYQSTNPHSSSGKGYDPALAHSDYVHPYVPNDLKVTQNNNIACARDARAPDTSLNGKYTCRSYTSDSTGTSWGIHYAKGYAEAVYKHEHNQWVLWVVFNTNAMPDTLYASSGARKYLASNGHLPSDESQHATGKTSPLPNIGSVPSLGTILNAVKDAVKKGR